MAVEDHPKFGLHQILAFLWQKPPIFSKLGLEPQTALWDGVGTPETFVVSMNLHRRHLNESQRAMIAAKLATRTRKETLIPDAANRSKLEVQIRPSSMIIDVVSW